MAKFTDLPIINHGSITDSHVFAVATTTTTDQLSLDELQRSFTGITARTTDGISILGKTTPNGITVGDNGFLGVDNTNPVYALDIGDYGGATQPEIRLASNAANRQTALTLTDSGVYWRNIKKASDKDYYLEVSEDGSTYTGVLNVNKAGNLGIFDGSYDNIHKLYSYGGDVVFGSGAYEMTFDPSSNLEISTNTDSLYLNYSNSYGVVLGQNVLFVDNSASPKVGINNIAPSVPLDVFGSGTMFKLTNSTTSATNISLTNTAANGYIVLSSNGFSIGSSTSVYSNGLFYNISTKNLGIGSYAPDNKLHVFHASQNRLAKFENNDTNLCEVFQVNNATSGPWHNLYTFGRFDGSENTSKWGIGLYDDDGGSHDDYLVFRVDASLYDSAIKASLDRNGNFDIDGSYTTSGSYCRGKFIQVHQTRVTGNCVYFNPFYPDSEANPSGSNDFRLPFGIAPFNGSVEKIQVFTSDQAVTSLVGHRFEFSAVDPVDDTSADHFVKGFYRSPNVPAASLPVSGVVGQISLEDVDTANTIYAYSRSQFSGVTTFSSGQLLQYRISVPYVGTSPNGGTTNVDFTVVSTISYTIT